MINCVILEDEKPAAARLALMLTESKHAINLLTTLHSLEEAVTWMKNQCESGSIVDGHQFDRWPLF
jgi:hypothetical protein